MEKSIVSGILTSLLFMTSSAYAENETAKHPTWVNAYSKSLKLLKEDL